MAFLQWKRGESVEAKLGRYFDDCDECFDTAQNAFDIFFEHGLCDEFETAVQATHRAESRGDDMRREIELMLYGRALLPESRGDILGLLETYDKLPNVAETAVTLLLTHRIELPPQLVPQFQLLVRINMEAYALTRKCVDTLMTNPRATLACTKEVDLKESESDRVERQLLHEVFDLNFDAGTKLLLKEPIRLIGMIADRAETVADRIAIIAIKRQV
jgi:hypothetical protein